MPNSVQGKSDSPRRLVSEEEALVLPENARPSDDTPTVISKTTPIVEPTPSSQQKIIDLNRKPAPPESIVAGVRGQRLAHFELIEPIGVGGMAAVIRARDTQLDRLVALKILPPEMAQEPENVQRFHQEAKSAAKLDHANIARVFFCGEDQGLHFIAFEYVEGMNLRRLMEKRGRLSVAESIRYAVQIATGLEHAVTRGVVHRDVKPSNIIITPDGQAKLVDMGLARNLERNGERDLTHSGMTLGTFDYISPEQALEPREADARSDIYSLGCTLYHLLTGEPPVPDGTPAKKLDHHQHHQPIDPRQLNPDIPLGIVRILDKMMRKNPKDRYQRPIHVVHHLMKAATQAGVAEGMPEVLLFTDMPLPSEPRHRPLVYIGLALLALVVVIVGLSLLPETAPSGPVRPQQPYGDVKGPPPKQELPVKVVNGGPTTPLPEMINDTADLKRVLLDTGAQVKLPFGDTISLESNGLAYQGRSEQQLDLGSSDQDLEHKIVSFRYKNAGSPFGINLETGKSVTFRRIRFVIDSDSTPVRAAAAVAVRGVKKVTFEQCIFIQNVQPIAPKQVPLASVYIAGADNLVPVVNFKDCYFGGSGPTGGQVAVAINGPATINVSNSAFQPHGAFFSFRDRCTEKLTSVNVKNSIGFVEQGPAFRFSANASARLDVRQSVFARPGNSFPTRPGVVDQPGLISLAADASVQFVGRDNLYHNLNALVENKGEKKPLITNLNEFQTYLQKTNGSDLGSTALDQEVATPLHAQNPLDRLENVLAFQLKPQYHGKVGLQTSWSGAMPEPPALVAKAAPKKIVDADDTSDAPGVHKTLQAHLSQAIDGDIIYIKHGKESREVVVPAITLNKGSVTLKPYEGFRPVLVLDKEGFEKDSALFTLQKSRLQIEHMKIVLAPAKGNASRSVVKMGDSAQCVFKSCTFSMRPGSDNKLNIVTFVDLDQVMMKMDPPVASSPARVEFDECFVRGKGDLVALQGCRLLHVDLTNSLVVLDGSLLDIDASPKEMPMDQGVHWKMTGTSVFSRKSLFALHAPTSKALTRTHAEIKGCLLASLALDQSVPIIALPPNVEDNKFRKYVEWKGERNFYANFDTQGNNLRDWKDKVIEVWKEKKVAEMESDFGTLTTKLTEDNMQALWDATPDMLKPMDAEQERMINGFGMPPELEKRLLPPPALPEPDGP